MRLLLKKIAQNSYQVLFGEEPLLEVHKLFLRSELISWDIASKEAFFDRFLPLERRVCLQLALQKVSRKAMHSAELYARLAEAHFSEQAIDFALSELKRYSALNDSEYLEHLVERLQKAGKSSRYIQAKCRNLGIDLRELARYLKNEKESLRRLVAKRYPILLEDGAPYLQRQKAMQALYRQGFSPSLIAEFLCL